MSSIASDQSPSVGITISPPKSSSSSKLRYPLRSSSKSKDGKMGNTEQPNFSSSSSKRGRPPPAVCRSVNVLDLSGKEKSAMPPRRLSIPNKSAAKPRPAPFESISPLPRNRPKRADTPITDLSKSMSRRKFCVLTSGSYWLTQIKLAEASSKHSISLGFFKLALDSGCEPLDRMQEELKSYVRRHNLAEELEGNVKEIFNSYNIIEDLEKLSISDSTKTPKDDVEQKSDDKDLEKLSVSDSSESPKNFEQKSHKDFEKSSATDSVSKSPKDVEQKPDKETQNFSSNGTLTPKSLNSNAVDATAISRMKGSVQKNQSVTKSRDSIRKSAAKNPVKDSAYKQKKPQTAMKENKKNDQTKKQGDSIRLSDEDETNVNKENTDVHLVEEEAITA